VLKDRGRRSVAGSRSGRRSVGRGVEVPGHQLARLMQVQRRWTWQSATATLPHDTALKPSLRGDFLSVNCGGEQLVPAEGHAVLCGSRVCAFAQAYGLHRLRRSMSSASALRTCAMSRR
jgi:hypothetical protein